MAEISLRQYVQQIDDIIEDSDQLEEAIAHCRHILKSFPKHIDTYRLLGKAYLESKRYGDAADIFQRVLSAIPDDFVSHVGMAIIREDEGNLDAAIWHMERSSESKPGNAAIEQELKRLIGKRDGLEPQRVRPTRGALARMYSHGELYAYATTELRKALSEDPDRPDLQVLLANTYWRTDQRLEAAKICSLILEKLPHCRDANRITAALLQESGKTEEAKSNVRRLISLDPYFAYLKNPMDDPLSVETSSILIERLMWSGGLESMTQVAEQPDWVASLSVNLKDDDSSSEFDENMPEWLRAEAQPKNDADDADFGESPTIHPFEGATPPNGDKLPEWMQQAGSGSEGSSEADDGGAQDQSSGQALEDADDNPGDIAAAEFPDWLSEITSSDQELPQVPSVEPNETAAGSPDRQIAERADIEVEGSPQENLSFENTLSEDSAGESEIPEHESSSEPNMSRLENYMSESADEEGKDQMSSDSPEQSTTSDEPKHGETQELPPWLEPAAPGATDTIVTWLGDKSGEGSRAPADDVPTWMRGTGPLIASTPSESPQQIEQPARTEPPLENRESTLGLSAQDGPQPETDVASNKAKEQEVTAESESSPPAWLEEISEPQESDAGLQNVESAPDWVGALPVDDDPLPASPEATEEKSEYASAAELSQPELQVGNSQEEPPDWLKGVIGKDDEDESAAGDLQSGWLQGVTDEADEQEIAALDALPESPEWLTDSIEDQAAESPVDEVEPEWLQSLSESSESESQQAASVEDTGPEWLTEMQAPEQEVDGEEGSQADPMENVPDEMPLREAIKAIPEDPIGEAAAGGSKSEPSEQSVQRTIEGPSTEEIAPDWLQDLSASEPTNGDADRETINGAEAGDWLQQIESDEIETSPEVPEIQISEPGTFQEIAPDLNEEVSRDPEIVSVDAEGDVPPSQTGADREIENRLEWLKESAQEVTPEPEMGAAEELATAADGIDGAVAEHLDKPMDEEEVYGFLEGLASKHEVKIEEIPIFDQEPEAAAGDVKKDAEIKPSESPTDTQDELPEEYEAGLEWLEKLATDEEYEDVIAPDFQSESAESESSEVPDWLEEVAERSEEDDGEAVQPGSVATAEDPSILDTIIAKKSDLAMSLEDQLEERIPPKVDEMNLIEIEVGAPASALEKVDSQSVEGSGSVPEDPSDEIEAGVLDDVEAEKIEPKEDEIDETSTQNQLKIARSSLQGGDLDRALDFYTRLIDQKKEIEDVIADLKTAVNNTPKAPTLWQALGDAYMQDGQITEAITAYRRGMEAV